MRCRKSAKRSVSPRGGSFVRGKLVTRGKAKRADYIVLLGVSCIEADLPKPSEEVANVSGRDRPRCNRHIRHGRSLHMGEPHQGNQLAGYARYSDRIRYPDSTGTLTTTRSAAAEVMQNPRRGLELSHTERRAVAVR